jgi:hypothetical protein
MKYIIVSVIVAAIVILFVLYYYSYIELFSDDCVNDCVKSHSQNAGNYSWLAPLGHGKVLKVEFEEPANSNNWNIYSDKWWKVHCDVLDHNPDNLAESHYRAFVDPATRFARLRFTFEDGNVLDPTRQFYELEADYFRNHKQCN